MNLKNSSLEVGDVVSACISNREVVSLTTGPGGRWVALTDKKTGHTISLAENDNFDFYNIIRKPVTPVNWPPQEHDVWEEENGTIWHILKSISGELSAKSNSSHSSQCPDNLKNRDGLKLVYRKGNELWAKTCLP